MYFTDSTTLTSQLVLVLTGTKAPFLSSLAAFHSIFHIYGKHIAATACTFDSPSLVPSEWCCAHLCSFPEQRESFRDHDFLLLFVRNNWLIRGQMEQNVSLPAPLH